MAASEGEALSFDPVDEAATGVTPRRDSDVSDPGRDTDLVLMSAILRLYGKVDYSQYWPPGHGSTR